MRRFYLTVFTILALAIILINPYPSFAYEKELKSISTNMSEKIAKAGKKTVAVVDFTDLQGNVTELGRFIAEEFSVALADADKGFEIVDRTHLQTLLKEHKLSTTGIIDPSTAKKLGEIAGVDALVTGTITPFGDNVRISVKILDTSTAKVIGASSGEIAKTKAIEELLARGIETAIPDEPGTTASSASQTQQTKVATKTEMPFFKNDIFKITAKSLKKTGNTIRLELLYENIAEKNVSISLPWSYDRLVYLIDENGERWMIKEFENFRPHENNEFLPNLPKSVKYTFTNKDNPNGTIFTAVMQVDCNYGCTEKKFQIVIRNIKGK